MNECVGGGTGRLGEKVVTSVAFFWWNVGWCRGERACFISSTYTPSYLIIES